MLDPRIKKNMPRNVFVSYKYSDENVQHLNWHYPTKARHYVDEVEKFLRAEDHICFAEHDGEDLTDWEEDEIWEELKDRIFPTSCTIVLISPNMKEPNRYDRSQWIPWEISYSLKETVRADRKSHRNAILGVVLPDKNGNYDYALRNNHCCPNGCITYINNWMFTIIRKNMFNRKHPYTKDCAQSTTVWYGEYNYIPMVSWDYFVNHVSELIERAERIKDDYERNDSYELHLGVNQ